jgi:hypothetical protein
VTEKFVEYLAYKATYDNAPPNEDIPDFIERIDPEIALELYVQPLKSESFPYILTDIFSSLAAADYLEGAYGVFILRLAAHTPVIQFDPFDIMGGFWGVSRWVEITVTNYLLRSPFILDWFLTREMGPCSHCCCA